MKENQDLKIKPSDENTVVEVQYEEVCSIPETGGHCIVLIKPKFTEDISDFSDRSGSESGTQSSDFSDRSGTDRSGTESSGRSFRLRRKITTHRRR